MLFSCWVKLGTPDMCIGTLQEIVGPFVVFLWVVHHGTICGTLPSEQPYRSSQSLCLSQALARWLCNHVDWGGLSSDLLRHAAGCCGNSWVRELNVAGWIPLKNARATQVTTISRQRATKPAWIVPTCAKHHVQKRNTNCWDDTLIPNHEYICTNMAQKYSKTWNQMWLHMWLLAPQNNPNCRVSQWYVDWLGAHDLPSFG